MSAQTATSDVRQQDKAKVFISYSRKDMAFADRLEATLKVRGFEPLIDRTEIYAFEEWWKRIEALIARADTVVFVLSPDSVSSEVALKEVAFAASLNKRFAPVVARQVDDKAVPTALAKLNFIFFDDAARFEESAERLADALSTDIGWIRMHTEVGEAARRWGAANRPGGLLLRSPLLEEAERWIAARPANAPAPTEDTQAFVRQSRQGATRRRNVLTGSLAAGLVLALSLAGLAYWQRGVAVTQERIAVEQRGIAERNETQAKVERDNATRNFKLAQKTAESLVSDIAQGLRNVEGMRAETVRKILETAKATFEQLTASAPDDPALQLSRAAMLIEFGDTYRTLGDQEQALKAYRDTLAFTERLAAADRNNPDWQHNLSFSYERVGDVLKEQGKLDEALSAYRDSLVIVEHLVAGERSNTTWQSDLAVSYEKVGNVLVDQGKLNEALKAHQDSLAIRERLAALDRDNTGWQRSLSVSYENIGDVLKAQGQLDETLKAYRDALAIQERLAGADRGNTQWQFGLSISYYKIGDVLRAQRKLDEALKAYRDSLAIVERLVVADRSNTTWELNLAATYDKVGDTLRAQGKLDEALKAYRDSLAIAERLAALDRSNAKWQRELSIPYQKIGDMLRGQGKLDEALKAYRDSLAIVERLVAADRSNTSWQRDLFVSYSKIGSVLVKQDKLDEALKAYRDALAVAERLAALDRSNAQWRRDFEGAVSNIGAMAYDYVLARKFTSALEAADQSIALAPDQLGLYPNRAYALMFLGKVDEARALYLRYRGAKNVSEGKPWEAVVLEDFAELRTAGLTHPLMDEIEVKFKAGG